MLSSFLRAVMVLTLVAVCGRAGGPEGAGVGAGLGFALVCIATIVMAGRVTALPVGAYLRGVTRPLLPCMPMYLAVVAVAHGLAAAGVPLIASLVVQILAGALIYIAAALVLVRPGVDELIRIGREALRRPR